MKAVVIRAPGGPEVLELRVVEEAKVGEGEVLIKVVAAALNKADCKQRKGNNPPPHGRSLYPGLECSGIIDAVGSGVSDWKVGDEVCALLPGGGYAEKVSAPAGQVMPIPKGVSLRDAAGFPEVACTVWSTLFMTLHLSAGETLLIQGGGSGIGTFAIQLAKAKGCKVICTAGTDEKVEKCIKLGADIGINHNEEDFVQRTLEETNGDGVNVILDIVGAPYLNRNMEVLAMDGRIFILGMQDGFRAEVNIAPLMKRNITIASSTLRARTVENKASIVQEVIKNVWPEIESGKVKPVVENTFPLDKAVVGHRLMESNRHFGKILLLP
ncbi:unnamed protein product [Sphagnum troendelagicum]|uniref:Enoyl reductase (ER) domain-containing protein n=1 Tax=Sphagnum jensenii TaxID=128206 RepID=A0ABP0W2W8_9BRYO